jgi:hypothetical protein
MAVAETQIGFDEWLTHTERHEIVSQGMFVWKAKQ